MVKLITSAQNLIIKNAISIKEKKNIIKHNACLVESEKIVLDLINANFVVKSLFVVKDKELKYENLLKKFQNVSYLITSQIAHKLSDTVTPSGIFAVIELPKQKELNTSFNFLVLDNLQDPSNLGAIIRSALAFNINQIVLIGGVYPYLPKVIRSSMGYVFNINFMFATLEEFKQLKNKNFTLISADLHGENVHSFKVIKPYALVIGNEGQGVSQEISKLCDYSVTIPMNTMVESLNASISASVLMYELNKK